MGCRRAICGCPGTGVGIDAGSSAWVEEEGVDDEDIRERLYKGADKMMAAKAVEFGPENYALTSKSRCLLQTIDAKWRDHLLMLEHLRSVVGFRSYAQRDPLERI